MVLSEEERQLQLLKGDGKVGTYYGRSVIVSIVFCHQSRRDINTHYLGTALVQSPDDMCESAADRLVQSSAEEGIDGHVCRMQFREYELGGYLFEQSPLHL